MGIATHFRSLSTKLYGKIINILIISQSFIKNDYFCGVK